MPRISEPARRTLGLYNLLRKRRSLSTAEAARHLHVDADAARRDLHALLEAGLVGKEGEGRAERWVVDTIVGLAAPTAFEEISLLLGRDLASFLEGTPLHDGLVQASEEVDPKTRRIERKFFHLAEPARQYRGRRHELETVLHALLDERLLTLTYPRTGYPDTFVAAPLTLVLYRRAIYLLAREPGDPDVLRLAVDRITAAQLGPPFDWPDDWDPAAELRPYFGIHRGGIPDTVILRFQPEVAHYVRARTWHPTQRLVERPDGGVELRMEAAGHELVRLACEWGQQVEVLAPTWLRERVRDELAAALARYTPDRG